MAEKSDIPRASASLRSITRMVRITGAPGVDCAPVRAWTSVTLVPPRKEEDRCVVMGSRPDHAGPRPKPILTQEVQWDQEMVVPHEALPAVRLSPSQSPTITSGYDFRKGHRRISAGSLPVSWHSPHS